MEGRKVPHTLESEHCYVNKEEKENMWWWFVKSTRR